MRVFILDLPIILMDIVLVLLAIYPVKQIIKILGSGKLYGDNDINRDIARNEARKGKNLATKKARKLAGLF